MVGNPGLISVSIVSHGQEMLVEKLLENLQSKLKCTNFEVLLTFNIPPKKNLDFSVYSFPLLLIENLVPKGFGTNHNAAFKKAHGEFFCVLNPDILFIDDPFSMLCNRLNIPEVGMVAPKIIDPEGILQDSAREYPSPLRILKRVLNRGKNQNVFLESEIDWVAGMFMLFKSDVYNRLCGFDERYFMYCEDADICFRLKECSYKLVYINEVSVIHDAQRTSHKELKYVFWHAKSLIRFFISHPRP